MYPSQFFSLFPPFPRDEKVFVAMSFDHRFDARWEKVIVPAIGRIEVNGKPLEAHRVDARRVSDSILTEILTGISNARLVLADISTVTYADGKPIRSSNAMYEVGLAHAVRLPEEVLLFRSDSDHLLFDVANVRVNHYDPENQPDEAQEIMGVAVIDAIKELDLRRNLTVERAVTSLSFRDWLILFQIASGKVNHPVTRTMGDALSHASTVAAISRLLDMGILQTDYVSVTPELFSESTTKPIEEMIRYKITPFGEVVAARAAAKMITPELAKTLEKLDSEGSQP